jgi:hypothetical protein
VDYLRRGNSWGFVVALAPGVICGLHNLRFDKNSVEYILYVRRLSMQSQLANWLKLGSLVTVHLAGVDYSDEFKAKTGGGGRNANDDQILEQVLFGRVTDFSSQTISFESWERADSPNQAPAANTRMNEIPLAAIRFIRLNVLQP